MPIAIASVSCRTALPAATSRTGRLVRVIVLLPPTCRTRLSSHRPTDLYFRPERGDDFRTIKPVSRSESGSQLQTGSPGGLPVPDQKPRYAGNTVTIAPSQFGAALVTARTVATGTTCPQSSISISASLSGRKTSDGLRNGRVWAACNDFSGKTAQ